MTATDSAIIGAMTAQLWTCLGCGDPLPPRRGGHCAACVEWETSEAFAMARPPEPDPIDEAPGDDGDYDPQTDRRCRTCGNSGQTCLDCGVLDLSALGRKLRHEMRDDRVALIRRLRATPRRFWRVLARAFALEIGVTDACDTQPTISGIVSLWAALEREAA